LRTRTATSRAAKLAQQRLGDHSGQPLDEIHALLGADLHDAPGHRAVVHRAGEVVGDGGGREVHASSASTENHTPTVCSALLTPWWP